MRFLLPDLESFPIDIDGIERVRKLFANLDPSRKRRRAAILATMDASVQRAGPVLPGVLPLRVAPIAALSLAQGMCTFDKAIGLAFTSDARRRVIFANEYHKMAKRARPLVSQHLTKLGGHLSTARLRPSRKLPPNAPSRSLNIPLIMLLTDRLDYTGEKFARDLVYGMGIVGRMGTTNFLASRYIPATTNMEQAKTTLPPRNRSAPKSLPMAKNHP